MMKAVVAVENAGFAFSKALVDAFLASTAPAASTARSASSARRWIHEIGGLAESAWMPLRLSAAGGSRLGEVVRAVLPVGSCAVERQYRGEGIARHVDDDVQERTIVES
jgi:hypothetical protein